LDEPAAFVRRTLVAAILAGATGTMLLLVWGRGGWAVAFSVGAAVSLGNFQLIAHAVRRLEGPDGLRAPRHLWKGSLFRFAFVGLILVVAVAVLRLHLLALVAGLLVTQLTMIGCWLARSLRATN
jgi:hypothetical protein